MLALMTREKAISHQLGARLLASTCCQQNVDCDCSYEREGDGNVEKVILPTNFPRNTATCSSVQDKVKTCQCGEEPPMSSANSPHQQRQCDNRPNGTLIRG